MADEIIVLTGIKETIDALKQFDKNTGKSFIFELNEGGLFNFKGKTYKKGITRRTRIECVEMNSKRTYLFNQNAEVNFEK